MNGRTPLLYEPPPHSIAPVDINERSAASMISLYRKNNGLGPVTVDPALMALAESDGYSQDATGHLKTQQVLNIMKGIDGTSNKGTSGVAENIKHNKCKDWLDEFVLNIYWVVKP